MKLCNIDACFTRIYLSLRNPFLICLSIFRVSFVTAHLNTVVRDDYGLPHFQFSTFHGCPAFQRNVTTREMEIFEIQPEYDAKYEAQISSITWYRLKIYDADNSRPELRLHPQQCLSRRCRKLKVEEDFKSCIIRLMPPEEYLTVCHRGSDDIQNVQ